jgi:hypothetical protein
MRQWLEVFMVMVNTSASPVYTLSRRQFLAAGMAGVASLALPQRVQARSIDLGYVSQFNPTRFIAGLLLDAAKAVLVQEASDMVVNALLDGKKWESYKETLSTCAGFCGEKPLRHDNYKAAVVVLGVVDYQAWKERERQRQLEVLLKDTAQMQRFQAALDYLRDEKIEVQLAGMEYAKKLGKDVTPDALLSVQGAIAGGRDQLQHYAGLIDATGTTAFNKWKMA